MGAIGVDADDEFITALGGWADRREFAHGTQFAADTFRLDFVSRLLAGQTIDLVTAEMGEYKLRSYSRADGVVRTRSYFLGVVDDSMLYVTVSTGGPSFPELSPAQLETLVDRLRAIACQAA